MKRRTRGPESRFVPTKEQERAIRELWHGKAKWQTYVKPRIEKIAGMEISRNWLNHHLGSRSKPCSTNPE